MNFYSFRLGGKMRRDKQSRITRELTLLYVSLQLTSRERARGWDHKPPWHTLMRLVDKFAWERPAEAAKATLHLLTCSKGLMNPVQASLHGSGMVCIRYLHSLRSGIC